MRRRALTGLTLALAVFGGATAHAVSPRSAAPATVRVSQCSQVSHSALFHARMKPIKGSARMAMRVRLQQRSPGASYANIEAPGLGKWRRSKPGVGGFGFRQRVRNMEPGFSYRARVDFRWTDEDGTTLLRKRRRSRTCRQAQPLPNLRISALALGARADLPKGVDRYRVTLLNNGRSAATGVPVRLSVDGAAVDTSVVARLDAGESRELTFTGPACERGSSPVKAVADPEHLVAEGRERDNGRRVRCDSLRR